MWQLLLAGRGTIATMSPVATSHDPTANGFQITENYVLGPSGEELTTLDGSNTWLRTNWGFFKRRI